MERKRVDVRCERAAVDVRAGAKASGHRRVQRFVSEGDLVQQLLPTLVAAKLRRTFVKQIFLLRC